MSRRILIYRLGSLGDTIVVLPALKLVARAFPDAERWMLTNFSVSAKAAPVADVLAGMGLVHGYIEYPIGMRSLRALWALRTRLRATRADTLVYLAAPRGRWRTWRDALFFRACGIRRLVGVPYRNDQRQVRDLADGLHEYEGARLARCVAALGDARVDDPVSYDLALTTDEIEQADCALSVLQGRRLLSVSIGTKVDVKDWEEARWQPLLERLARRYPVAGLVFVGARDEYERCERLAGSWAGRCVNLCGTLSVRASAAALMRCDVFIGHDSGPMHLAASVRTPCVAIFSSRNQPGEWFPHGQGHRVLYTRIACEGCKLDVCVERNKACIRSISVEAVEQAVAEVVDAAQDRVKPQQHAQCQGRG